MNVNAKNINLRPTVLLAGVALLLALSACKGRTTENMEPTGDTVEEVITDTTWVATDSTPAPADSSAN